MSLPFNDTTTYKGIVQIYEKEIQVPRAFISGNTTRLKELTADVNLAFDDFTDLAIKSSGTFQFDDSNQTDYPIITTNIVSGQRDYSFTTDETGNLILDIYKVLVASSSGVFAEVDPLDVQSQTAKSGYTTTGFWDGRNTTGIPTTYDKTANAVFLDPIPNYNYANGLKLYINREPSYFVYTDTTKKAGVPGLFHRYLALKPALDYARRNKLPNFLEIQSAVFSLEQAITDYYAQRPKDERRRLTVSMDSNR